MSNIYSQICKKIYKIYPRQVKAIINDFLINLSDLF